MKVNSINNTVFLNVLEVNNVKASDNFSINELESRQPTNLDVPKRTISEASINGIDGKFDEYI